MALWKPFRGTSAALADVPKTDGHAYFCTDDGSLFFDYKDENNELHRKQITAKELTSVNLLNEPIILTAESRQYFSDKVVEGVGVGASVAINYVIGDGEEQTANGVVLSNEDFIAVVNSSEGDAITLTTIDGKSIGFSCYLNTNNMVSTGNGSAFFLVTELESFPAIAINSITEVQPEYATKSSVDKIEERVIALEKEYEPLVTLTTAHAVDSTYRIANVTNSNFLSTPFKAGDCFKVNLKVNDQVYEGWVVGANDSTGTITSRNPMGSYGDSGFSALGDGTAGYFGYMFPSAEAGESSLSDLVMVCVTLNAEVSYDSSGELVVTPKIGSIAISSMILSGTADSDPRQLNISVSKSVVLADPMTLTGQAFVFNYDGDATISMVTPEKTSLVNFGDGEVERYPSENTILTHSYAPSEFGAKPNALYIYGDIKHLPNNFLKGAACLTSFELTKARTFGESAFENCVNLVCAVMHPETVTISKNAFKGCTSLKDIDLRGVTTIAESAFENCSALTSITLPDSLRQIEANAFKGTGLTTVIIPAGVTTIADTAFDSTTKLITASELSYLDGVTSNIQAQLNTKGTSNFTGYTTSNKLSTDCIDNQAGWTANAGTVTEVKVGDTSYSPASGVVTLPAYPTSLPASDVSTWAKAAKKPEYAYDEITGKPSLSAVAISGSYNDLSDTPLNATTSKDGLMSSIDKEHLDTLAALLEGEDSNSTIDTITEVLKAFENAPEGTNIANALASKVDKVSGKGLSTNDFTAAEKEKLAGIAAGATANMQVANSSSEFNNIVSAANVGKVVSYNKDLYIIGAGAKEIEVGDNLTTIYFDTSTEPNLAALSYEDESGSPAIFGIDGSTNKEYPIIGAMRWDGLNIGVSGYGLIGYSSSSADMTVIYSTVAFTVPLLDFTVYKGWNVTRFNLTGTVPVTKYEVGAKSVLGHVLSSAAISSDSPVAISMLKHEEDPTVPA